MRLLKTMAIILAVIGLLFVGIGFLLPQHVHVERSHLYQASTQQVYALINGPKVFNQWSPWATMDAQMKTTFSGPETGVGAAMRWQSEDPSVGTGSWTIIEATPDQFVKIALSFSEMSSATATLRLSVEQGKTRLTWELDEDMGSNPTYRWIGLMLDSMVGGEYEKGLKNLHALLEKQ